MPNWKKVIVSGSSPHFNHITASGDVSGSATSTASFGHYVGIPSSDPFPFTGDAQISGSLIVSQSYTAGDTDSTALRLIGSGSVSQSGIFEVEGSAGPLFSVQDGLDGVLMEVNNISGLPLFQVSSSNEVFVNRGNLTSGVTTATASFAMFSGSFQGNGSQLTNVTANTSSFALTSSLVIQQDATNKVANTRNINFTGNAVALTTSSPNPGASVIVAINTGSAGAFPFTGDAQITGSLTISGSLVPGGRNKLNTNNVVIGRAAGENMSISTTAGIDNTLIGAEAGNDLTNGNNNVLVGYKAGEYLTTSQDVIAIGKAALGADNTAGNALNYVIAIGSNAGGRLQGGINDGDHHGIYIGRNAGINIDSNDGNRNNILIGHRNVGPSSQGHFGEGHLKIGQGMDSNAVIFPISASLTTGSVLIPQLKVDSVNTANSASGTTLSVEGSGSTIFDIIGSEGTLFSIDDDLDGVIFTANDRSGLPALEVSASGEVYIGKSPQSLYTTAVISSTTANISQSIYGLSTSSYGGVFVDYTANSGSNARAGSIMSIWNGSSLNFTETTTLDIGDTSNLLMQVAISQSQAQVQSYATTAGYNIKTIIRSI